MKQSRRVKKPESVPKLILEEVIGLTTKNANGLASTGSNSKCAYIAGCVVVVYDVDSCTQSHLSVPNRIPKPLSSVAVSPDGSLFAAGESGDQPAIVLWEGATTNFLGELKGHQFGVACMAFSPDGKQLVSVGYPRDGYICLWDLRSQMILTKIKACSSCSAVASVSFSSNAKFIVTAGRKHLKFWTVELSTRSRANTTRATSAAIHGKPVNLGHQKGQSFIAATSPNWIDGREGDHDLGGEFTPIYALTDAGVLYLLSSGLAITNTVDLKVKKGFALSISRRLVACACNSGIVKLFYIDSLAYAGSLYFTNGRCNKAITMDWQNRNQNKIQPLPTFPDAIACQFSTSEKLVVIYDDRSLYIWSLHDVNKATRSCVLVSHSACIWDIKNLPCENAHDPSLACVAKGCPGGVSFATCSADGTIRLWDLALQPLLSEDTFSLATYNTSMTSELGATKHIIGSGIFERDSVASGVLSPGFRSMAVSSDGKHLAAGDCLGNIHILNLCTYDYLCILDAHDAEILSLNFSLTKKNTNISDQVSEGHYFLASGGQDRMIHIFDIERDFDLVGSVDDHSDSVKSVKFTSNGRKIASCGANGSVVLHDVAMKDMECKISPSCQITTHGFICDMASDPSAEVAVVVGEDKKINIVNIPSGKLGMSLKHDEDIGELIKVTMDPSCSYMVSSYSNGSICMHDYATGKMVAQAAGHGGVITGVIFLPDCKHLASVADDGCIFLWKMPGLLSSRTLQRMEKDSRWLPLESIFHPDTSICDEFHQLDGPQYELDHENVPAKGIIKEVQQRQLFQDKGSQEDSAFQFSVSRLPKWAQVKVTTPGPFPVLLNSGFYKQGGETTLSSSTICVVDNTSAGPELRSPSRYEHKDTKQFSSSMSRISSGTDISQGSSSHKQNHGSFALDSRWSTIHTVCFDLLNSPEDWKMKDQNLPPSALSNLSKAQSMETTKNVKRIKLSTISPIWDNPSSKSNFGLNKHTEENKPCRRKPELLDNSGTLCDSIDQCWVGNSSLFDKEAVNQVSAKLQSATTERGVLLTVDAGASNMDSQHNYISKKERRKSSARKSHLGRFVVRMDFGDKKNFQDMFVQDSSSEIPRRTKKPTSIAMLEDAPIQLLGLLHKEENGQKDEDTASNPPGTTCNAPTEDSTAVCQAPKSTTKDTGKESRVQGYNFDRPEQIIMGCKDALFHLDAAADSALKLFSQLANLSSTEEILQGPEIQFRTEATEMLLPIAKKVNAITKLVKSANAIPLEDG